MGSVSYDFDGETVVVTGGASGIGRAVALAFARAGADVVVADVRERPADEHASVPTHRVVHEGGGTASFVETDVREAADVETLVAATRERGGLDVMVNAAGVVENGSLLGTDTGAFGAVLDTVVRGTFNGTQAAARDMAERDVEGCIVNVPSASGIAPPRGQVAAGIAAGAVGTLTRTAARELAGEGVRVNAVLPGPGAAAFALGGVGIEDGPAVEGGDVPLGRTGFPEDVAPAALFLASEGASFVTGELLAADGGWDVRDGGSA